MTGGLRTFVKAQAVALMFASTLTLYLIWMVAWFNGGRAVLLIDYYGEQMAEFLIFHLVVIPVVSAGIVYMVQDQGDSD